MNKGFIWNLIQNDSFKTHGDIDTCYANDLI